MKFETLKEHEWLQKLVGDWTFEHECPTGPDQPMAKFHGTEVGRSLGGVWVVLEGRCDMPEGGVSQSIMTLGYDPAKKCYVGTFIASMMTHLWIYERGELSGNVLTLDAEGPSWTAEGKMAKYQDIIEIKSDSERTLSSRILGDDGRWQHFMTATYRRTK